MHFIFYFLERMETAINGHCVKYDCEGVIHTSLIRAVQISAEKAQHSLISSPSQEALFFAV